MGTGITTHPVGVAVTKVDGAYNIVDNIINFYTAPQAYTLSSITNPPDERDWTGITTFSKFQGRTLDLNKQVVQMMLIILITFLIVFQINLMQL